MKCVAVSKYLWSLHWFTDIQTCYQPLYPHGCLFVVGWVFFVFNIASDCSTFSLGNICTHFCTTNTAKPVSIFFLYISPSGTFTLTQNESLASQSFLATFSFEKWYNSHFREGLVSTDGFLSCQIAGVMAHASSVHTSHPASQPLATRSLLLPALHPVCWQRNSIAAGATRTRNGKVTPVLPPALFVSTEQGQLVLSVFTANSVSFFYPNCSSFSLTDCRPVQRETCLPCMLLTDRAPSSIKTDKRNTQHTQAEPTFNKLSTRGKLWAS